MKSRGDASHSPQSKTQALNEVEVADKRGFGSDNHSGVHPRILSAIARVNIGHVPSYGTDAVTLAAAEVMKSHFGPSSQTYFVFNGTAANVTSFASVLRPHHIILASQFAHIINDECGAIERILGAKTISVLSSDGKVTPEALRKFLVRRGDQHASQVKAISITQPTELGAVYTLAEIRAIGDFARAEQLILHMDGARLVNAAESLGCSLAAMTTECGVDVVSVGGTKNGLLFGEAVVFLNSEKTELTQDIKFARKAIMQLPSKTRFIAAQFLEFLGTDLWRENARHANQMAKLLALGLSGSQYVRVTQKTEANACFVVIPKPMISRLRDEAFFYVWDEHSFECRLMTTWDTREEEINSFVNLVEEVGAACGLKPHAESHSEETSVR